MSTFCDVVGTLSSEMQFSSSPVLCSIFSPDVAHPSFCLALSLDVRVSNTIFYLNITGP